VGSRLDWYDRIPEAERQTVDAYAKWLKPIPWQLFATFTHPWNVTSETADRKLRELINALERDLKDSICFVAGKERRSLSAGMSVPWHFHVLMTAHHPIPPDLVENSWRQLVRPHTKLADGLSVADGKSVKDDSVVVEPYDTGLRGAEYCLKSINNCHGDWTCRWLREQHPLMKGTNRPSHRSLRQERRSADREIRSK
jgi:hypothetical protein